MTDATDNSTPESGSGSSAFWPDSDADGLAAIVVVVCLVGIALHFVAGDYVVHGLLWVASLFG